MTLSMEDENLIYIYYLVTVDELYGSGVYDTGIQWFYRARLQTLTWLEQLPARTTLFSLSDSYVTHGVMALWRRWFVQARHVFCIGIICRAHTALKNP
jgi:hypothetical protein